VLNTHDIKDVYMTTTGFGPSTTRHHQVFIYRFRSSEGQDLVLLQSVLKITMYFTTLRIIGLMGWGGGVMQNHKLKV
jgi:hypothetical protein